MDLGMVGVRGQIASRILTPFSHQIGIQISCHCSFFGSQSRKSYIITVLSGTEEGPARAGPSDLGQSHQHSSDHPVILSLSVAEKFSSFIMALGGQRRLSMQVSVGNMELLRHRFLSGPWYAQWPYGNVLY
jgi:hypothetical protein